MDELGDVLARSAATSSRLRRCSWPVRRRVEAAEVDHALDAGRAGGLAEFEGGLAVGRGEVARRALPPMEWTR